MPGRLALPSASTVRPPARADLVLNMAGMLGPRSWQPQLLHLGAVATSLGLCLWLFWPTLDDGLFADDFAATAMMDGTFAAPRAPLDLFNFADGTPQDARLLQRLGSLPWWAPPDFRISFLRPLSSAMWHLDRALFGKNFGAYHAHSLLVFFLLVIAASLLYRELFSPGVGALATLMFALDDSHHFPVVWLSNRGGIYAVLFGVLALLAHLRWRLQGQRGYAFASAAAISVGLAFGEWALPMVAYIVAFELVGTTGALRERARALLPALVPSVVFLVVRALLAHGARGSGAYIDPAAEPVRFAIALVERVPVFVADMMWNIPAEWWDQGTPWRDQLLSLWIIPPTVWVGLPGWKTFHFALGLLGFVALGLGLRFCQPGLTLNERRHVRWLLLGGFGALVPVVGSFPSTRLTIAAFLGLTPVFALILREVALRLRRATGIGVPRFAAYYVVVAAIVHLQLYAPLQANIQGQLDHYASTVQWVLGAELDPQQLPKQRVFLLAGSEFTTTFFFAYIWASVDRPLPRSYYPISTSPRAQNVERPKDNELLLRALGGYYLASGQEYMFRSPSRAWHEGEFTDLDGLRVTAEDVVNGLPGALRLTFDRPLEDPSYVFLISAPLGLMRFFPPPRGEQRLVPRAANPSWGDLDRFRYVKRIAPLPEMLRFASSPAFVSYKPK